MSVWLWLVYKFTENYCRLRLFSEFIQTQKRYPTSLDKISILTLKTTCHIKLKIFLWIKLLEKLLIVEYLISVAATLSTKPTKLSNTQTIRRLLPTNCLSVFDHFVGLTLKELKIIQFISVCSFLNSHYLNSG